MLGELLALYPKTLRLVYKDFPLQAHQGARPAAEAARCAAASGRFWEYHDMLFLGQPAFSRDDLIRYAGRVGLDTTAFAACLDSGRFRDAVDRDLAEGRAAGVRATPTLFLNGRRFVGLYPLQDLREAVDDALEDAARK